MRFLVLLGFCLISLLKADDVVVNVWTPVGDGTYPPPKGNWPNMSGPAFYWINDLDFGFIAPILTETEGREGPGYRKFSFNNSQWEFISGKVPVGTVPDMWDSPKSYVYMPGLKKILFLKQEWSFSSKRPNVVSWLFNLENATWEPLIDNLSMSDKSADFNPVATKDGLRLPIWGAMCYDGTNKEALSFGGGGVWGRVGKESEEIKVGDWFFDETAKRVRRLTPDENKPIKARKWFPAHCGTWVFSESTTKWSSIEQPLSQQPSARILPGLAYSGDDKKIVLFGGDDLMKCFNDTWIYDCTKRTWSIVKPAVSPLARAGHTLVYVPDQKVVLMIGGYSANWLPLKDVWAYSIAKNEWTKLGIDLPEVAAHASADYDSKRGQLIMVRYPNASNNKKAQILTLKLDMNSVAKASDLKPMEPTPTYHCKGKDQKGKLPSDLLIGDLAVKDSKAGIASLEAQNPNVWVMRKPPYIPPGRDWGSNIYDTRTHRGYAWGGGHSTYPGADVIEYDVSLDRWVGMYDAPNYNPVWLHGMVGGPPGVSPGGWSLLPTHSRKSYGIDFLSNSMITYVGDVYDLKNRMFVTNIGICPGGYGVATQVSFCTTPHGLYGYSTGLLARADVKSGKWEEIAKGGPKHDEHGYMCYDSKRNKFVYFERDSLKVWIFDFAGKTWVEDAVQGKSPIKLFGDSTYIPELDAALLVFADDNKSPEKMYFYKIEEHKWYSAAYEGDKFSLPNSSGRDYSPIYDSELKAIVRIKSLNRMEVAILKLDVSTLKLVPLE